MKKTALFSIIVFVLAGCTSFLDIRTEGTMPTTGTDYTKSEAIFQSVSAAYAALRLSEGEAFAYISVLEIPSDDADKGSTSTDAASTAGVMDNFKYGPTTTIINDMWVKFYNIASAANHALEEMDEFKKAATTEELRAYTDECGAEAKVIRAYAYFNLVRMFGGVPLVDKTMTAEELASNSPKSEDEIYSFIYTDLDAAISILPDKYSKNYAGRFTSWTARALKAKVALYRKDWEEAATQSDLIIRSGNFSLVPVFRDVFSMDYENSEESLMEIQASSLGQSSGDAPICYYAFVQGPRNNTPSNMQGWGFKVPSQNLVNFLEGRGDTQRIAATILARGSITPEGDAIIDGCANPYYNGKVYTPSSYNLWSFNGYGFDYNMRIIRYAEILLIFAEAKAQGASSGTSDPQSCFDLVRARAGLPSVAANLDNIYDERRAELAMEENRFFDLVRTGKAAAALGASGFKTGVHEHFPIPAQQIQLNPTIPPTTGYTY
ncbi:MAG: RagB/SusD family nutrient uptake outer membrane protein [Bacteroidales bacterium]|nr:RagB/SusD family nutrient uptake outer membrane protein [Bacteroidales bacterium]